MEPLVRLHQGVREDPDFGLYLIKSQERTQHIEVEGEVVRGTGKISGFGSVTRVEMR
jgi:hypothetical protein